MNHKLTYLISLIILFFLILNTLAGLQLGLTVDGAHYALYGQHLAWSYFDHPPLVGWLQTLALQLGTADYILRIWPLLFQLATVSFLYYLTRHLFLKNSPFIPLISILFFFNAVILNLLGLELLPQTPLLFFSLVIAYQTYQITQKASWKNWLLLGLWVGLGGLADYTAVLLVIGILIYFILFQRRLLFSFKPYCAALISLICISPIIYWNAQHEWISFQYQLNHGFSNEHWNVASFLQSCLIQLAAYSLALIVFSILGIWKACYVWKESISRILICLALPIILLFTYSGGYNRILPHWPAVGWLLLIPVAARYVIMEWQKLWVKIFIILSGIVTIGIYGILYTQVFFGWINFPIGKSLLNDLYGWPQAAQEAKKLLVNLPSDAQHLFVPNWSLASRLAWYSQLPVQVTGFGNQLMQFDLWYGKPMVGAQGLLVVPAEWNQPLLQSTEAGNFRNCHLISNIVIKVKNKPFNAFNFYYCQGFL